MSLYHELEFVTEHIDFIQFNNVYCMYFFITTIVSDRNVPIVKIGFTNNLFERVKSLERAFKAKFKLIAVNHIDRLSDESLDKKLFHRMIKNKYGDQFTYNGIKGATELYYYDGRLLNEFYGYLDIEIEEPDTDISSDCIPSESEESSDSDSDCDCDSDNDTEMAGSSSDDDKPPRKKQRTH